jgi:hypothetical protein
MQDSYMPQFVPAGRPTDRARSWDRIRWCLDDSSNVIASWVQRCITPDDNHAFTLVVERRIVGALIRARLYVSADASPDLLRLKELTGVASSS